MEWRLGVKKKYDLWKDILEFKYGLWIQMNEIPKARHESWWWRDLCEVCSRGGDDNWFDNNVVWNYAQVIW